MTSSYDYFTGLVNFYIGWSPILIIVAMLCLTAIRCVTIWSNRTTSSVSRITTVSSVEPPE